MVAVSGARMSNKVLLKRSFRMAHLSSEPFYLNHQSMLVDDNKVHYLERVDLLHIDTAIRTLFEEPQRRKLLATSKLDRQTEGEMFEQPRLRLEYLALVLDNFNQ